MWERILVDPDNNIAPSYLEVFRHVEQPLDHDFVRSRPIGGRSAPDGKPRGAGEEAEADDDPYGAAEETSSSAMPWRATSFSRASDCPKVAVAISNQLHRVLCQA